MPIADGTGLQGADSCGIIITISRVTPDTADDFVRCSAEAFAITGRVRILLETLLRSRLSDARRAGFDFAILQARPTNVSARNAERAGFSLAYTRPTFSKQFT